jgi:hypothetical protein
MNTAAPILLFSLFLSLLSGCESRTSATQTPSPSSFLQKIPRSIQATSVFRENLLQERGIQTIDTQWYRPLGFDRIAEIQAKDNLYTLGKLPLGFSPYDCVLFLQDQPDRSRTWLLVYDQEGAFLDHLLVFDLVHPNQIKRWSYLQASQLEVYEGADTLQVEVLVDGSLSL